MWGFVFVEEKRDNAKEKNKTISRRAGGLVHANC